MSDSESSALSSPPASDDERLAPIFLKARSKKTKAGSNNNAKKIKKINVAPPTPPSPPRPKRSPSPQHEETLADNPDIAFITMFRSRFSASFPAKLPHYGPQDIERGVVDSIPSPQVEDLLCAILALALNRKKPIERGHHGRALEEAISSNKHQWPKSWNGTNLVPGSKTFNDLGPVERLNLVKTLIIWSLTSSEEISRTIKDSYKQTRHEDDQNQPLSVQPWGFDDDKRKYWLIEGQDDTSFRVYREGNRQLKNIPWRSVAGTIDEVKALAEHLDSKHHTQAAGRLAVRMHAAIPRFEATEEKRRRREYRQIRRAQFARPQPGFSLYEGRTRGKRARYTFDDNDDDDDFESDALSVRRSTRNQSDRSTPVEQGPTVTASGRTVKPRGGGAYGEALLSGRIAGVDSGSYAASEMSDGNVTNGRATRAGRPVNGASNLNGSRKRKHRDTYNSYDGMSDEETAQDSGDQWAGGDDLDDDKDDADDSADNDMSADEEDELLGMQPKELIVRLKVGKKAESDVPAPAAQPLQEDEAKQEPDEGQKPLVATQPEAQATVGAAAPAPVQLIAKPEPMEIDSAPAPPAHPIPLELPSEELSNIAPHRSEPAANGTMHKVDSLAHPISAPEALDFAGVPATGQSAPQSSEHVQLEAQVQANGWS
ncbi:hypothetical protein AAFC00_000055 [Neodothiora populina]|uniref:WHIM1 domain-containing protein n=1 Tax=Neodothiora populina TaxID=2781224 RepID=A0ABR3P176_9PEZI